jgi:hypothetical protein
MGDVRFRSIDIIIAAKDNATAALKAAGTSIQELDAKSKAMG